MATKFFIGANKFYDTEEEANADLLELEREYGVPAKFFTILSILKTSKNAPGGTFKPEPRPETVH